MPRTVRVVCETMDVDESVTVPEDALVLDLLARAGMSDSAELLTHVPVYHRHTQPITVSILQPVTSIPKGETIFVHERE